MNEELLKIIFEKVADEQSRTLALVIGCIASQLDATQLSLDIRRVVKASESEMGKEMASAQTLLKHVLDAVHGAAQLQTGSMH